MSKHNDKAFKDKIQMSFRMNLEKQFRNGLTQGMYAACKVISEKATDESKSAEERIQDIVKFCNTAIVAKDAKVNNTLKAVE